MDKTNHRTLPKTIKDLIGRTLVKELKLNEVKPFVDPKLKSKPNDRVQYIATNDHRYPSEIAFLDTQKGEIVFFNIQQKEVERISWKKLNSTHWVRDYLKNEFGDYDGHSPSGNIKYGGKIDEADRTSSISKQRAKAELKQQLKGKRADGLGDYTAIVYGMDGNERVALKSMNDINNYSKFEIGDNEDALEEAAPRFKVDKRVRTIGYLRSELQKIETMAKINDPAFGRYKNDFQKAYRGLLALSNGISRHGTNLSQGIGEGKLTEDSFSPGDKFGGQDGDKDYKYKKYVSKAFEDIIDATFNFRHAMGVKQLGQADPKVKKQLDALHTAIVDLQKEMKSKGLTEGVLNEIEINDPVLIAVRARQTMIKKNKEEWKGFKKLSLDQYWKKLEYRSFLEDRMKDAAKELEELDSEMNQDAGQKGDDWTDDDANRYGGDLDKLQTKIEKLAKLKVKVNKAIMHYRTH